MKIFKKIIPKNIKIAYHQKRRLIYEKQQEKKFENSLKELVPFKKIYIMDACDHMNLGDQAILMAEIEFLSAQFKEYKIITSGLAQFNNIIDIVLRYIRPEDLIVLHGGGNVGNIYKRAENIRREIIKLFPLNQIILFPQTMYFTNDADGEEELQKSIEVYSEHEKLILIAREETSYSLMKTAFKYNSILLTPDIVLNLDKSFPKETRKGALLCCRNDLEGILSEQEKSYIHQELKRSFTKVSITDTVGENSFNGVEMKLKEFKTSEIVITDRLHGMVFAAITGTPSIILNNYNYKVAGTYEWIKHLDYIKFAEKVEDIPNLINELKKLNDTHYNNDFIRRYYNQIISSINVSEQINI